MIGVLALQGDVEKHLKMLERIGAPSLKVRSPADLEECRALIIPGGESTAIRRQIAFLEMEEPLKAFSKERPLFGTCAGLILMAKRIEGERSWTLDLLDLEVQRNGYGRQINSFSDLVEFGKESVPALFIRAPKIVRVGPAVKVLGSNEGSPVLVEQGHPQAATFHSELTDEPLIHRYFAEKVYS